MPNPDTSSSADTQVLTVFHEELARAGALPSLSAAGPALWPRFARYYQGLARPAPEGAARLAATVAAFAAGIALLCALGQAPALAATITSTARAAL